MSPSNPHRPLILVTNDDGFDSSGINELAFHLYDIADILYVAPAEHHSGSGRSIPFGATAGQFGAIDVKTLDLGEGKTINAYAVHGTPALAAAHGIMELAERTPDLCISGINFGENVGRALNYSGTIGAAMEAADVGIPSIAISLELDFHDMFYRKGERKVFSGAARVAKKFALRLLEEQTLPGFLCLNINVPHDGDEDTPVDVVTQSRMNRWEWIKPGPRDFSKPFAMEYSENPNPQWEEGSDCQSLIEKGHVTITPLTWSMQSDGEAFSYVQNLKKS
jgi:5'-nucleotidase